MDEQKTDVVKTVKQEKTVQPTMVIPIAFAQNLIDYLQTKPYAEVNGLISNLLALAKNK